MPGGGANTPKCLPQCSDAAYGSTPSEGNMLSVHLTAGGFGTGPQARCPFLGLLCQMPCPTV
eukprot:5329423-Amphidinium_carterae.1